MSEFPATLLRSAPSAAVSGPSSSPSGNTSPVYQRAGARGAEPAVEVPGQRWTGVTCLWDHFLCPPLLPSDRHLRRCKHEQVAGANTASDLPFLMRPRLPNCLHLRPGEIAGVKFHGRVTLCSALGIECLCTMEADVIVRRMVYGII